MEGKKRPLVITADDVGLTPGINAGVQEAISAGRLKNVSLMVNEPAFEDAVEMLKKHPQVSCGLHINVYQGKPLTDSPELKPILGADGNFVHSLPGLVMAFRRNQGLEEAVKGEMEAQLDKFSASGLKPTHIDIHKFLAYTPVMAMSARLATDNSIDFIRWPSESDSVLRGLRSGGRLFSRAWISAYLVKKFARSEKKSFGNVRTIPCTGIFCIGEWTDKIMESILAKSEDDALELVMHPGRVDDQLKRSHTRLLKQREEELQILLSDRFGDMLEKHRWYIAGFGDI